MACLDRVGTVRSVHDAEPLALDREPLLAPCPRLPLWADDTLLAVGYSTVGAVTASYRPGNPVGWVLCSIGLTWGVAHLACEYATYALLAAPGSRLRKDAKVTEYRANRAICRKLAWYLNPNLTP
jgi:hypothetical protein